MRAAVGRGTRAALGICVLAALPLAAAADPGDCATVPGVSGAPTPPERPREGGPEIG
jgi:hypothetical protein